jgi:predicted double-glycine peptidase
MGKIIRRIPYKSQYDDDASDFRNDCGPACVAMILNGHGVNVSTNAVFRRTGAPASAYVSVSQMMRAAYTYGVNFDYFYPWDLNQLKLAVQEGKAPITLVHYGTWVKTGKTQSKFNGPHFVVIVGYDANHIYVNDPLWWGTRRYEGEHKQWTNEEFIAAWSTASKDGNRNYSGIYCTHPLPVKRFGRGGEPLEPPAPPPEEPAPPPPEPEEPAPPPYEVDPTLKRRIFAWAAYCDVPLNDLNSQAVVTAYTDAMGDWGLRVIVHEVEDTDTLPLLALKYYDDPMQWDVLVHFNGLTFTDTIHDSDMLLIPEPLERPVVIPPEEIPTGGTTNYDKSMAETSTKPHRSG